MKRLVLLLTAAAFAAALAGCSSDPARPPVKLKDPYHNLTQQVDVLFNLELAMNKRDAAHYIQLLDPDKFTFFFSPGDVANGTTHESWGFSADSLCARKMLSGDGGVNHNPILSIDLVLVDFENAVWTEYDPSGHPGVYQTTVGYAFSMQTANDMTYITIGGEQAQFRIHQVDSGGTMVWRLVEWNDIAVGFASSQGAGANAATEESTWGKVKALFQ